MILEPGLLLRRNLDPVWSFSKYVLWLFFCFFFKDFACQNLNLEHQCYKMDPQCQPNAKEQNLSLRGVFIVYLIIAIVVLCVLTYLQRRIKGMCWINLVRVLHEIAGSLYSNYNVRPSVGRSPKFVRNTFVVTW